MVPAAERPEHTEGREGYYHPTDISGTPDEVKLCYILRDFDATDFDEREATLRRIAAFQNARYGEGTVTVDVRQQYRNMAEKFGPADQLLIDYAVEANREVGIEPVRRPGPRRHRRRAADLPRPALPQHRHRRLQRALGARVRSRAQP